MTPESSLVCPRCSVALEIASHPGWRVDRCPKCGGLAATLALLRRFVPPERLRKIWRRLGEVERGDRCPSCRHCLHTLPVDHAGRRLEIDACGTCQLLWFDAGELAAFSPERQAPPDPHGGLSEAAREAMAIAQLQLDNQRRDAEGDELLLEALLRSDFGFPGI